MRIYMITSVLAPLGGIEAALVSLTKELKSLGHDIRVYVIWQPTRPNQNFAALEQMDVAVIAPPRWLAHGVTRLAAWRPALIRGLCVLAAPLLFVVAGIDALVRRRAVRRSFRGAFGALRGWLCRRLAIEWGYYVPLIWEFRRRPPNLVHVHGWGCGEDPPGALAWVHRQACPVVYTEHNCPDPTRRRPMADSPMNQADVIVAVSTAAETGLRQVGNARRPIVIIPYGLSPLPFTPKKSGHGFTVACVARLAVQKGQSYLIEAMAEVARRVPDATLLLVGEGPLRAELERRCSQLELSCAVRFLGSMAREDLPAVYAQTDVVALPSLWEGLPVTLLEAMSAGKPVVATNAGGTAELVRHGVNGLVVPRENSAALAQALIHLARDGSLRTKMGRASQEQFEQGGYDPHTVARRTAEVYEQAAAHAAAR
jgi:glycosyltransferase involved in cell wall biosynthesis